MSTCLLLVAHGCALNNNRRQVELLEKWRLSRQPDNHFAWIGNFRSVLATKTHWHRNAYLCPILKNGLSLTQIKAVKSTSATNFTVQLRHTSARYWNFSRASLSLQIYTSEQKNIETPVRSWHFRAKSEATKEQWMADIEAGISNCAPQAPRCVL